MVGSALYFLFTTKYYEELYHLFDEFSLTYTAVMNFTEMEAKVSQLPDYDDEEYKDPILTSIHLGQRSYK